MLAARHVLTILAVPDLAAAARFYEAAFGFDVAVATPVYVELADPGGQRLGLYERNGFGRNTGRAPLAIPDGELAPCELYFHVGDLAEACARLEAAGGALLSAAAPRPWGDDAAYYRDPAGHVVVVAKPIG